MNEINIIDFLMNSILFLLQYTVAYFLLTPKYKFYLCMIPGMLFAFIYIYFFGILLNNDGLLLLKQSIILIYYLCYILFLFKDKLQYKIIVAVFNQVTILTSDLLAGSITASIFGTSNVINNLNIRTLGFFFALAIIIVTYMIFIHFFRIFIKKETIRNFGMFILFPVSQIALLVGSLYGFKIYCDYLRENFLSIIDKNITIFYIIITLGVIISVIADIILYKIQKDSLVNKHLKENLDLANYRNELELEYYQQMQKNIEETGKIRHDFYNVLSAINDANEISSELKDEIETTIRQSSTASFCQNNIVNLIIVNKNKICLENNIRLDTDLDIPEEIVISKLDLLRTFSNILDNAIEANLKVSENRFIKLNAKIRDNYLFISAKNPLNSEIIKNNKHYETTKKQKKQHGFGMIILNDIAKKYDGELIAENDTSSFTTLISLKI